MSDHRPPILLITVLALVVAACGSDAPAAGESSTVATAPTGVISTGDPVLEAMLVRVPGFGGPWTVQTDSGSSVNALDLVCGAEMPADRPESERHAGRVFLGGEPFPVLLQAIDGFASAADAAAVVELHRAAAESCTSWTQPQSGDVDVEFTVRMLDLALPEGGLAIEVAAPGNPTLSASQLVMFTDGSDLWFLGYVDLEPDDAVLAQFLAEVLGT